MNQQYTLKLPHVYSTNLFDKESVKYLTLRLKGPLFGGMSSLCQLPVLVFVRPVKVSPHLHQSTMLIGWGQIIGLFSLVGESSCTCSCRSQWDEDFYNSLGHWSTYTENINRVYSKVLKTNSMSRQKEARYVHSMHF